MAVEKVKKEWSVDGPLFEAMFSPLEAHLQTIQSADCLIGSNITLYYQKEWNC